jgi:hypothetical protein
MFGGGADGNQQLTATVCLILIALLAVSAFPHLHGGH